MLLTSNNHNNQNGVYFNHQNERIDTELKELEIFELFIDDHINLDTAFEDVLEKARNSEQDPIAFCELAEQQLESQKNLSEAQINQIQQLKEHIKNSIEGETAFQILAEKIKENSQDLQDYFVQNIDNLNLFLIRKHNEMLALNPDTADEKKEEFRQIKHTFRDLFLAFAVDKNEEIKESYDEYIKYSFGRQDRNRPFKPYEIFDFFNHNKKTNNKKNSIKKFVDELVQYRKNYLCRYSLQKIQDIITNKALQIKNFMFKTPESSEAYKTKCMLEDAHFKNATITKENLLLLKTTFIHGTHSAILPNLPLSDIKLIPVGHLIHKGVIPLSGELREGAVLHSIKDSEISATTLDDGFRAMDYSYSYKCNLVREKNLIKNFLENTKDKELLTRNSGVRDADDWAKYCIAILRVRLMDEQFFNEHKNELSEVIEKLNQNFNLFKKSNEYKEYMPKKLDPDGTLGYKHHDYYWFEYINTCENNLNALKNALTQELKPINKDEIVEKPFAIIFGSTNIRARDVRINDNLERRTQKFCQLGKEIDFLAVNSENMAELNAYLEKHDLDGKIKIVDFQALEEAMLLNKLASHYFADFASRKKLAKIFNQESNGDVDQVNLDKLSLSEKIWKTCMVFADHIWGQ